MPYSTVPSFLFLVISIYLFCHWICEARTQCWNLRAQGRLIVLKRQVPFCNFNLKKKNYLEKQPEARSKIVTFNGKHVLPQLWFLCSRAKLAIRLAQEEKSFV